MFRQFVGGTGGQPDHAAQQQIHKSEEHVRNLPARRRPDRTNALVEVRISGLCALQALAGEDRPPSLDKVLDPLLWLGPALP